MDIVTKKQLNVLIQLAKADQDFAPEEQDLIYQIASRRNFPTEVVDALIRNPEPIESLGALSRSQKFEYLISSIELVFADNKILDSELEFSRHIAMRLGFKKDVVDFLIRAFESTSRENLQEAAFRDYY